MRKILLFAVILHLLMITAKGYEFSCSYKFGFIENNGQIVDQFSKVRTDVLFIGNHERYKIILKNNSFSYEFYKILSDSVNIDPVLPFNKNGTNLGSVSVQSHRIDIEFVGANPLPVVISEDKSNDYINYYLNKSTDLKIESCYSYQKIIYKDIYPGIDLVFYCKSLNSNAVSENTGSIYKYDFIIHPGSDPGMIKMKYTGDKGLLVSGNKLEINTIFGSFNELAPTAYNNGKEINIRYHLANNVIAFNIDNYDKTKTLTIDPYLMYASYYGGTAEDVGLEICSDKNDNIIITGFTASIQNIATSGAHQVIMKGDHDAFITKFNNIGERLWATYFGASDYDTGHGIAVSKAGDIAVGGWTRSKIGISTTGANQYYYGGGEFDSYIVQFDSSGRLKWATYLGGLQDDYINDVVIDGYSNILLVGRTSSNNNISTFNTHQTDFGGIYDAFVVKFSSNGKKTWGTYLGGSSFDVGMEICTDIFNEIAITGFTQSSSGIASPGSFKNFISGNWDSFIAKFTTDGVRRWSSYFGGSDEDNGWGIASDGEGNIYLTGYTFSDDSIATTGAFNSQYTPDEPDAFLAKFSSDGSRLWSTYYGASDDDKGNVAAVDPWNNIFFTGNTYSNTNMATTGAYQENNRGGYDAFVAQFDRLGNRIWATYYGGSGNDFAHGLIFDSKARLFFTGYTFSPSSIATSSAYQTSLAGNSDAYFTQFGDPLPNENISILEMETDEWCADEILWIPYQTSGTFTGNNVFTAQLSNAAGMFTEFFDIGTKSSSTSDTIMAKLPKNLVLGDKYRLRIVSSSPKVVGLATSFELNIHPLPKPLILGNSDACSNNIDNFMTITTSNIINRWEVAGGTLHGPDFGDTITVEWDDPGAGIVKLTQINTQTGCSDSSNLNITIYPQVIAGDIFGLKKDCPNIESMYYIQSVDDLTNDWEITGGKFINDSTSDTIFVRWNETSNGNLKIRRTSTISGCNDSSNINVTISPAPKPNLLGDTIVKAYSLTNFRTNPGSKYNILWTSETGLIQGSANGNLVEVLWGVPGTGSICLHLTDKETGCEDSVKYSVKILLSGNDVILGNTEVCEYSSVSYLAIDSSYFFKWYVQGGVIDGDSTKKTAKITWGENGSGVIKLVREHKDSHVKDSVLLTILIKSLPDMTILGDNESCEDNVQEFYTSKLSDRIYQWSAEGGKVIGSDNLDRVFIHWDKILDKNPEFIFSKIILTVRDNISACDNTKSEEIKILNNPVIELSGDTTACQEQLYVYSTIMGKNSIINWEIQGGIVTNKSGDTTFLIQWEAGQTAQIKIVETDENACIDSLIQKIVLIERPLKPIITQSGKKLVSNYEIGNQWFTEGEEIEGATTGTYVPVSSGFYSVRITDNNGCVSDMSEPYSFDIDDIKENMEQSDLVDILPNPANDYLIVKFSRMHSDFRHNFKNMEIKIFNLFGKCLINKSFDNIENNIKIDIDNISGGVYYVIISINKQEIYYKRIVKY